MKGFSNSNLFLSEFIFRCPSITFLALSYLNDLILERQYSLEKLELTFEDRGAFNSLLLSISSIGWE